MKQYLKMADVFDLPILGSRAEFFPLCLNESSAMIAAHAINSHDELVAEVERLRQALIDAATSLETIHVRSYGEDSFLDSKQEMRSYAGSRAKIARAALSEQ